jgi:hypothetical protein
MAVAGGAGMVLLERRIEIVFFGNDGGEEVSVRVGASTGGASKLLR